MDGTYTYCLNNHKFFEQRIVGFSFHTGDIIAENALAKKDHLTTMETSCMEMAMEIMGFMDELSYYRERERLSRDTNESTNSRVQFFGIFKTFYLVLISIVQVLFVRKLFETKRGI